MTYTQEEVIQNIKDCGQSIIDNAEKIATDCYFDECKDCMYREYSDDLYCCAASRLGLAWYRLIKEIPIINKLADDYKYCNWFLKEE